MDLLRAFMDQNLEVIGVSKLKALNSRELSRLDHVLSVVHPQLLTPQRPLAVVIPYDLFLEWQRVVKLMNDADLRTLVEFSYIESPTLDALRQLAELCKVARGA